MKTYLRRGKKEEEEMVAEGYPDDKDIITGLQQYDRHSADDLVKKYIDQLVHFLEHRMNMPWDKAEELVDDVFAEIAGNPGKIRPGTHTLRPFLYAVSKNRALDWHRKRKREEEEFAEVVRELLAEGEISDPWMEPPVAFPEPHIILLRQSLSGLDQKKREVLTMWAERVPDKEVSEILGESEGAIRQRRKRALEEVGERYLNQLENKPPEDQTKIRKKLKLD